MSKTHTITTTGFYLEYREAASNSFKQYTVLIADDGVVVTAWGRIGNQAQFKIAKMPSRKEAEDVGLRQLYAKKSKGYETLFDDFKFEVDPTVLAGACQRNDAHPLLHLFAEARKEPRLANEEKAVTKHYDDFAGKAQDLLDTAADRPFEEVYADFEELEKVWDAIDMAHGRVKTTVDLVKQTLASRLMAGSTS